jgi:ATP-dependent RNA helicase RhlE
MTNEESLLTFDDFNLDERCARVLHRMKIKTPSPVQAQAIPLVLAGKDLVVTAQTGTGKTLAFALPALSLLARRGKSKRNRMLVLAPTRELCIQVEQVIMDFCKALGMHSAPIYGGVGMHPQIVKLERGCDIVVATPGRLLDHLSRGALKFDPLEILIFDEADRMLDMGFMPDIQRILKQLPKARQTLMFSATFPPAIERLTKDMMQNPERISVGQESTPVSTVRQLVVPVRDEEKFNMLLDILKKPDIDSALVFLRTIRRTDRVARMLKKIGQKAVAIHGDLPQSKRQQALEGFRKGKYKILVATDVAARGLDINDISHVINYDIPQHPDDYVHRIGRTARAAREGDAITFVTPADHTALGAIEQTLGYNIERQEYEGAPRILTIFTPHDKRAKKPSAGRRRGRSMLRRR